MVLLGALSHPFAGTGMKPAPFAAASPGPSDPDSAGTDAFYHWGGLLGLITFIERGHLPDFLSLNASHPKLEKQISRAQTTTLAHTERSIQQ